MTYRVTIKGSARKELEALPDPLLRRADATIVGLSRDPRPRGCMRVRGTDLYRIRCGDHRVLYRVNDHAEIVEVVAIGHRREVYR